MCAGCSGKVSKSITFVLTFCCCCNWINFGFGKCSSLHSTTRSGISVVNLPPSWVQHHSGERYSLKVQDSLYVKFLSNLSLLSQEVILLHDLLSPSPPSSSPSSSHYLIELLPSTHIDLGQGYRSGSDYTTHCVKNGHKRPDLTALFSTNCQLNSSFAILAERVSSDNVACCYSLNNAVMFRLKSASVSDVQLLLHVATGNVGHHFELHLQVQLVQQGKENNKIQSLNAENRNAANNSPLFIEPYAIQKSIFSSFVPWIAAAVGFVTAAALILMAFACNSIRFWLTHRLHACNETEHVLPDQTKPSRKHRERENQTGTVKSREKVFERTVNDFVKQKSGKNRSTNCSLPPVCIISHQHHQHQQLQQHAAHPYSYSIQCVPSIPNQRAKVDV